MIADQILKERYYQEGEDWAALCKRVAQTIAKGQAGNGMEEIFYQRLLNKDFLPNSPTLMNAGLTGTLSACFTVQVDDNMDSIMGAVRDMAIIGKYGGGVGANWSNIRASGSKVGSTNGVASGPVSFLQMVNTMADVVKQGGRRRIAVMSILDVTHPDIEEFITAKTKSDKLNNMNISVMIPDSFMADVFNLDPKALKVWNLIVSQAHSTGEPGILFYGTINRDNVIPSIPIRETNPCAEQPMIPYSSCNLISIDVGKLVNNQGQFQWNEFAKLIEDAVKFADATIDVNVFPLEKIKEITLNLRPIGLGVMGFAYALIKQGIVYGSEDSFIFAKQLTKFLRDQAEAVSESLADLYGAFPLCSETNITARRNAYLTSIAPTGTISTIADTSFGIEPLFSISYTRNVINSSFKIVDPYFKEMILKEGLNIDEIIEAIVDKPSIQDVKEIPEHIKKLFVTAHDVTASQHVAMVAACQESIDTGISKTINMSSNATIKDVDAAFKQAYISKCKGITIYRNGSRDAPIKTEAAPKIETEYLAPDITYGITSRVTTGCGHYHVGVSGVDGKPLKVFITPTTGGCKANLEAIGRLTSLALISGISPDLVIKQLSRVQCNACLKSNKATCKSCASGVADALKLMLSTEKSTQKEKEDTQDLIECSSCKKMYVRNTKCGTCPHCGYSQCS